MDANNSQLPRLKVNNISFESQTMEVDSKSVCRNSRGKQLMSFFLSIVLFVSLGCVGVGWIYRKFGNLDADPTRSMYDASHPLRSK